MNTTHSLYLTFALLIVVSASSLNAQQTIEKFNGVKSVELNSESCIELSNDNAKVVLSPTGGRVLKYEVGGKNVLFLSDDDNTTRQGRKAKFMSAGRFDVGPEQTQVRGEQLFSGQYSSRVFGDRDVVMTSVVDPKSKMQINRRFQLAKDSSKLTIIQSVTNRSDQPFHQHYWSRTFAVHGGVIIIPVNKQRSLLPNYFLVAVNRFMVDLRPTEPAVREVGDFLVVDGPPSKPKLGFDATKGWVAYQTRQNQLFVKRYPIYPDRKYGDPGNMNFAIWYPKESQLAACEIEPIGPLEFLQPGETASYRVDWFLIENEFPEDGKVDPVAIRKVVEPLLKD